MGNAYLYWAKEYILLVLGNGERVSRVMLLVADC